LFVPEPRQAIVPGPFAFFGQLPRRSDPALCLQPMQRRVQRPGLDLEQIFRGSLNVFGDEVAVSRAGKKSTENEQVERALEQPNPGAGVRRHLCRHSTLFCVECLRLIEKAECKWRLIRRMSGAMDTSAQDSNFRLALLSLSSTGALTACEEAA